ncbi:MAG: DUF4405 domain-containing protein [Bacteroidales bacterium]|nr:MAG: DUF4405 domain-containing protein [Bacteroidales bacterium]
MNMLPRIIKDKFKLNLSIDLILFVLLMPIAGIGFLMSYILIPGSQVKQVYGNNIGLEFLGLDRHQWGEIHLWIGFVFLLLMVIHVILHWSMIVCYFQKLIPKKEIRIITTILISAIGAFLFFFAFLIKPEVVSHKNLHQNRSDITSIEVNEFESHQSVSNKGNSHSLANTNNPKAIRDDKQVLKDSAFHHDSKEYDVYGSQLLLEIAEKYNVPCDYLCNCLNIPHDLASVKLGRLKKQYRFEMKDVSNCISKYKKQNQQ